MGSAYQQFIKLDGSDLHPYANDFQISISSPWSTILKLQIHISNHIQDLAYKFFKINMFYSPFFTSNPTTPLNSQLII